MIISKITQNMVAASLQYRCIIVAESPHRKYYLKSNASYGYSNVTFSLHFCNDNPPKFTGAGPSYHASHM